MLKDSNEPPARIPIWRNVKTIGTLAQIIFALVVIGLGFVLVNNVTTALSRTNIPANFDFMTSRAGVPIAETPIPYSPADPYWKALVIGLLNTLRVALVGVVLATLLGILIGVMRLSKNYLARQVATGYVELIRNTPLAVQIIFWFTAVLTVIPPQSSNPLVLPGGVLVSNIGIGLPWLFPTYAFGAWLPWLLGGLLAMAVVWILMRRRYQRLDRPGRAWPAALLTLVLVAGTGYFVVSSQSEVPADATLDYILDRGRGTVFLDTDGNGSRGPSEALLPYAAMNAHIPEGVLSATTSNVFESRRQQNSTFRFPVIFPGEYGEAAVGFVNPADAERFSIHFTSQPSRGIIYEDRNGNGEFDDGEEISEAGTGFSGVRMNLTVTDFSRHLVADRDGQVRLPRFEPVAGDEPETAAPAGGAPGRLFGAPVAAAAADAATLVLEHELLASGPLVLSKPAVAVANYDGGIRLSTSYLAILLSLVIYTAAFMAEIVRAGIQAVSRGQTEASMALGLSTGQTFSLVVFPQALRIILPPMISQYLNLTKNSSLAPLAAYGELFAISVIVANQTGASVPVTLLLIAAYVVISLIFALILNIVNARIALVER